LTIKTVSRIDKAMIVGKVTRTDDGYLKGSAVVARTGILEYFEDGKIVRELVTPEELSRADSLETLKMKPLTNGHPSVSKLDAKTCKQFQVGFTGETVKVDNGLLYTTLTVNDSAAIHDVENGKRELSAGYDCTLKDEPGIWNGQRYDRIQIARKYNHVAICSLGRAGDVAALHLDAADVYEVGEADFGDDNEIPDVDGAWRKELGTLPDGACVYLTDLAYVQKHYNREYEGGHSWAYDYIGTKEAPEIWIPMGDSIQNTRLDLTHEIVEYMKMRYEGMDYEKAHECALAVETIVQAIDPLAIPATEKTGGESAGENKTDDNQPSQRSNVMKYKIDSLEYEAAPEVVKHIEKLDAAAVASKTALDTLTADRDTLKDKLAKLDEQYKKDMAEMPGKLAAATQARIDLERQATPHLDKADADGIAKLDEKAIKLAVIKKAFSSETKADASDVYIQARYDSALEVLANSKVDAAAAQNRVDSMGKPGMKDEKKPRTTEDAEKEVTDRWKKSSNRDQLMK